MNSQSQRNPPLNSLKAFEAVARNFSVTKAAQELRVTHSAISQQIKLLENYLGLKLVERTKGRIILTEIGRKYADELNAAFSRIAAATDQLLRSENNIITINVLTTFAIRWLIPRLADFQQLYPHLEMRISTPAKEVNFERESIDMAVYYGKGDWKDLHIDFLFDEYLIPVCSPKLASKFKDMSLQQILHQNKLIYVKTEERKNAWQLWLDAMGLSRPKSAHDIHLQNSMQAMEAAINDLGIAIAPELFVKEDINSGRLIKLTDKNIKAPNSFYLVSPKIHIKQKKISLVREWLLKEALSKH